MAVDKSLDPLQVADIQNRLQEAPELVVEIENQQRFY